MQGPSEYLEALSTKLHQAISKADGPAAKYTSAVLLGTLLMDASRPDTDDPSALLSHLKGRTSAVPVIGIERRVQIFGMSMQMSKGKIALRATNGEQIFIENDAENSGLHLLDVVLSKLLEEKVKSPVAVALHPYSRMASINSKRYYETDDTQYAEYLRRCTSVNPATTIKTKDFLDVVDKETGEPKDSHFKAGEIMHLTTAPPLEDIGPLLKACDKNKSMLDFPVMKVEDMPRIMAKWDGVRISSDRRMSYYPKDAHPAAPLVTGHECVLERNKYLCMFEQWIADGKIIPNYDLLDPTVVLDNKKFVANKPIIDVFTDQISGLDISKMANPPQAERDVFFRALSQPANEYKRFLDSQGFTYENGDIFEMNKKQYVHPDMLTGCKEVCKMHFEMSAIETLKKVHWVLTSRELYDASVFAWTPKQPWLAAIVLVCRRKGIFKLDKHRYLEEVDDFYPPTDARVVALLEREALTKKKAKDTTAVARGSTPSTSGPGQREHKPKDKKEYRKEDKPRVIPQRRVKPQHNNGLPIKYLADKPGPSAVIQGLSGNTRRRSAQPRRSDISDQLAALAARIDQVACMRMPVQPVLYEAPPQAGANGYCYAPSQGR